ncbi:MAG: hypothetical protein AABX53_03920 [Nanoarchaeota archaeon]
MVEKDTVVKEKLKYAGLLDLEQAYKFAYEWLKKEDLNVIEDSYSEKVKSNGKELEIEWTASKKVTDYFKITVKIKWRILGLTDVEVEIDGRKKKMNKAADLSIELKSLLEKDYSNKWEGSAFNKFIKEVYNKYVIPQRTDKKEDDARDIVQNFKEEMKAFLELTGRK